MPINRTIQGLLCFDGFDADSIASYTAGTIGNWSVHDSGMYHGTEGGGSLGFDVLRRSGITTAKCVTALTNQQLSPSEWMFPQLATPNAGQNGFGEGYVAFYSIADTTVTFKLRRADSGAGDATELDNVTFTGVNEGDFLTRILIDGTNVEAYGDIISGSPAFDAAHKLTAADDTYTTGMTGALFAVGAVRYASWLDIRTSHLVTFDGLGTDWYFVASDGVNSKSTKLNGDKTVLDAGNLVFPLANIAVYDASDTLIDTILNTTYSNMGGGDTFVYSENPIVVRTLGIPVKRTYPVFQTERTYPVFQ